MKIIQWSKDPEDQIWDWIMIDGESSKADDSESVDLEIWLQLFWRAYLIKTSPDLTLNNYTKRAFTGSQNSDDRRHEEMCVHLHFKQAFAVNVSH